MIQNFITDPLLHNFMAPCYPIFIQIRYLLGTIVNKKTMKTAKNDIVSVIYLLTHIARRQIRSLSTKIHFIITYVNDRL